MGENELEKAFETLAEAFTLTESEIHEEISVIEQQIEELKDRIVELNGHKENLAHDKDTLSQMYERYAQPDGGKKSKVEF